MVSIMNITLMDMDLPKEDLKFIYRLAQEHMKFH